MTLDIKIFGEADDNTIQQLQNCIDIEPGSVGVLCADNHLGYSQPIGGAVAYRDHISPSGVGYDIGCGNKAVKTSLHWSDIREDISGIMDEIVRRISFGVGQDAAEETHDHPVFDSIANSEVQFQQEMIGTARKQLGTVGAGNHYVDLFKDETDRIWIGVHFGSRGFGHKTASGFLALAEGKEWHENASGGEMMSPPVAFHIDSALGYMYIHAMEVAGEYAYAGRDVVCEKVLDILGAESMQEVHNHHNFAWRERHNGEQWWVIRKGCTPAFPGQQGFVGSTMAENSVILEGTDEGKDAFFSTVHGAGRVMSRTQAAGKFKRRKKWLCNDRDCDYETRNFQQFNCPDHPDSKPVKRQWREQTRKGEINFDETLEELGQKGIELRGGAADEAPGAYKRLDEVLAAQGATINVLHTLTPVGVAMAGRDTYDPFKD
jgi:tRNA-splicing ligase RtcB